jgi:hypothetical protein
MFTVRADTMGFQRAKGVVWLLGLFGVLWVVAGWIAAGASKQVMLGGIALIVLAITLRVLNRWREGFYIFLVWLLFEDLIRKYMGNNFYIFFAKDFLVAATYASLLLNLQRRKEATFRPPFLPVLTAFLLLGVAQVFNPNSPSLLFGLMGVKMYFYYIPLMFVGYALLRTEADLQRLLVVAMALAGVIALLGIIQSIVGLDFLNPRTLAPELQDLAQLTRYTHSGVAVPRPCSVFVSDGRFASYVVFMFVLGFGTAAYLLIRAHRGVKIAFLALALVAVAEVMTGSRGAFVYVVINALVLTAGLSWGVPKRWSQGQRLFKAIRRSLVGAALALLLTAAIFPKEIGARWTYYKETLSPDSPNFEAGYRVWDYPMLNFVQVFGDTEWTVGHGIGTGSLSAPYVVRAFGVPDPRVATENGYGLLVLELGILGPLLWVCWTSSFALAAWKVVVRVKSTPLFPVALCIFWFAFLLLFPYTWGGMVQYQNYTENAYLWLLTGVLFRLPGLTDSLPTQQSMKVAVG